MVSEEANLAFDLTIHERLIRKTHQSSWASVFIDDLKGWAREQFKEAKQTLRDDTGPSRDRHLHAHRRILAILEQEIDLLQQGVEDSAAARLTWPPDAYLRHCICTGSAIITGAEYALPFAISCCLALITIHLG